MKNLQTQWQGFQATPDDCIIKIQIREPPSSNCFNTNNKLTTQIQTKKNINIRKKKKERSKTLIDNNEKEKINSINQSFIRHSKSFKSQNKIINSPAKTKKNSISSVLSLSQYQKIPIAKYNQNLKGQTVIYTGYFPQSSNKYFINYLHKKDQSLIKPSIKNSDFMNHSGLFNSKLLKLEFDSKFQSGNLAYVTQNTKMRDRQQYNLFMKVDTNTYGHRQWFYFSMKSFEKQTVKLNIYRFVKRWSLFQKGMKPYGSKDGKQWYPIGKKIEYNFQQEIQIKTSGTSYNDFDKNPTYFLSFLLDLEQNQTLLVCSGIPYTFTYLKERIKNWSQYQDDQIQIKQNNFNKTFGGLDLPILTISPKKQSKVDEKNRYIIIISRTHPGQTSSSWVSDGLISYLTCHISDNQIQLMKKFNIVFKIIPMMNPDGVVIGNYRTGILGEDFNRKFLTSKDILYPEVDCLKKLVSTCKKNGEVELFLDLHGHSVKKNSFIYAPEQNEFQDKLFSKLTSQLETSRYFSMEDCKFKNQIRKIQTARVFFQIRQEILSMTCQNSLGLFFDKKKFHTYQFRDYNWRQFGKQIASSIFSIIQKSSFIQKQQMPKQKMRKLSWKLKQQQQQMFFSSQSRSKTCETSILQDEIKKLDNFQNSQIKVSLNKTNFPKKKYTNKSQISSSSHSNDILADVQINEIVQIPQDQNESINDSDDESQNLPAIQRKKLFAQVQKIITRPNYRKIMKFNRKNKQQEQENQQSRFLKRKQSFDSKYSGVNRFKQYRFGNNQFGMSMTAWQKKKVLLGLPKSIRNQIESTQRSNQKSQKISSSLKGNSITSGNQHVIHKHQYHKSYDQKQKPLSSLFFKNKFKTPNIQAKNKQIKQFQQFSDTKIKIDSFQEKKDKNHKTIQNHKLIKNSKLQSYFISIRKQISPQPFTK